MNFNSNTRYSLAGCALALVLAPALPSTTAAQKSRDEAWLSPVALAAAPDGKTIFVACKTANRVLLFDPAARRVTDSVSLPAPPTGLCVSRDGSRLFVTCAAPDSQVCVVDTARARIVAKISAGHSATAPALSPDGKTLFVCNRFDDDVSVLDVAAKKEVRRVKVVREPVAAALTADGRHLLVANLVHNGRADADDVAAAVSVIDTAKGEVVKQLKLPNGSGSLMDLRVSPDGKYAVVTHILSRFHLPTTQLDRGWINTNAKTIIDLTRLEVLNTVLLDTIDRGAANPWGVAWSADSQKLVVVLSGTHEISVTDFPALLAKLAQVGATPVGANANLPYSQGSAASRVPADVPNDLSFLVGVRERRRLPDTDLGPRGVVVVGRRAYTANYFSDTLTVAELDGDYPKMESIALGPKPKLTQERQGELNFHDARLCFQGWQSCSSCHPGEARVDALNWDLLNDGIGNPKNNKNLLFAHQTPPSMSLAVRASAEVAVRAGIRHSLFTVQPPEVADAIDAYLKSLKPVPSPHLVNGQLSTAARRGSRVFRDPEVGCAKCHVAPLFTDRKVYDVGTVGRFDKPTDLFDTPTLVEVWRTAPYLHDGSAVTIRDVLKAANAQDKHGQTSHLTAEQINDLIEYVLSL